MARLTGVSRIDSTFRAPKARARAAGSPAAYWSRLRRASAATRSRWARSVMTMKSQGWEKPTDGAWWAAASSRAEHVVRYRVRQEALAHVAALGDDPVDGGALVVGVRERTLGLITGGGAHGSPC